MDDGTIVQVVTGRYVLQLGESCGGLIREVPPAERKDVHRRPGPILLRPKLMRGLVGREPDVDETFAALEAGLPVEASGERGIGKTAVLRHLAHDPRAGSFGDGIIYFPARRQSFIDLQQLLFEAFYESGFSKPTEAEIRRGLQATHALILIDDVHLAQDELEQLFDTAPRCGFVVATRARRLWGEVHSLALNGLSSEYGVSLLEREIERSLDAEERSAAERLCTSVGGSPLRIRQAAALIREQALPIDEWGRIVTQSLIENLLASVDDKQRRALLALASVPGVALPALHIAGSAEVIDIEPALAALVSKGLVVRSQSRYRLAEGVADRLRRTDDLKPWASRVVTYFAGWAQRHARKDDALLQESEALLRVQHDAADARRSGEVLHLGRLLDRPLAVGLRWGSWGVALERCLDASRAIGDRSSEAWALHQLGSRALCLGDAGTARALLTQAVRLREALNDDDGAAASRANLTLVLPPPIEEPRPPLNAPVAPNAPNPDIGSVPFRDVPPPTFSSSRTQSSHAVVLTLLFFIITGSFAFWTYQTRTSVGLWDFGRVDAFVRSGLEQARARIATLRNPRHADPVVVVSTEQSVALASDAAPLPSEPQIAPADRASILIFTPRPGSITTGGPTSLCYAVGDALQARLEPDVGIVAPTRTLTCVRVAPSRTTTYELTAYGRDGHQVRQQLVIVVR